MQLDKRIADAAYLRDVASEVASREEQGRRQGRRRGTSGGARMLLSLLLLAFCAALLYAGPIYPSSVQQLHLHLRLPQASQNLEVNLGGGGFMAEDSVQSAVAAAVSRASTNTLSFEVCSGFAHQRVDIVFGEFHYAEGCHSALGRARPKHPSPGPQVSVLWPLFCYCAAGLVLAAELNRTLVLPRLLLDRSHARDGQDSDDSYVDFG
jgi:hypothetical protein